VQLGQANSSLADLKGHIEMTEEKIGATSTGAGAARSRANRFAKSVAAAQKLNTQLTEVQKQRRKRLARWPRTGRREKGY
jgi:hypothetical protein